MINFSFSQKKFLEIDKCVPLRALVTLTVNNGCMENSLEISFEIFSHLYVFQGRKKFLNTVTKFLASL